MQQTTVVVTENYKPSLQPLVPTTEKLASGPVPASVADAETVQEQAPAVPATMVDDRREAWGAPEHEAQSSSTSPVSSFAPAMPEPEPESAWELDEEEPDERRPFWSSNQVRWILQGGAVLIAARILIGFAESSLLGMQAMWVNLLTVETLVSAMMVYLSLRFALPDTQRAAGEVLQTVLGWFALMVVADLCVLLIVLPLKDGTPLGWAALRSPGAWLWASYAVLPLAGVLGFSGYALGAGREVE